MQKAYSGLIDDKNEDKKAKGIKNWDIKKKIRFEDNQNCLEAAKLENKIAI